MGTSSIALEIRRRIRRKGIDATSDVNMNSKRLFRLGSGAIYGLVSTADRQSPNRGYLRIPESHSVPVFPNE